VKKILVCGATGFMGRNISEYFSNLENFQVYGVANTRRYDDWPGKKIFYEDLTTQGGIDAVFNSEKFDIVIQAAATTSGAKDIIERPYLHVTDNAVMNSLILRACYDHSIEHFLFLSCGVMYNPARSPVTEKDYYLDEPIFKNYFGVGWTKVYVEKMCEFFAGLGKTKHTSIRHSNTYGPHDKYDLEKSHMFGATITKVLNAKDGEEIIVWGDGSTERDLLYVDDVVGFIHKAINSQKSQYELYNVGYGESFSVKEIVKKIIKISNKNVTIKHDLTKPSINTKLALISTKAKEELGWHPMTSLEEGIQKTIEWYKKSYKE
tara:strand:+ start:3755 stop:4714 length:960 start_codon:yes stop_codon:yes gene_type:complete